ncbi:MAG: hypothetical protein ABR991_02225 [Terracidiphilus sp.]|jgi:hypothetical protein
MIELLSALFEGIAVFLEALGASISDKKQRPARRPAEKTGSSKP